MQSSNSFIALGIGAVIAAGAIGTPATAEPGIGHRPDSKAAPAASPESEAGAQSVAQNRAEDRLDQLQTESQIRQQLNQSQFGTSNQVLSSPANSLGLDQQIQQQINIQDLQLQRDVGIRPAQSLDRLQFEQRVRRSLQQPSRSEPEEQSSSEPVDSDAPAETNADRAASEMANSETANSETARTETANSETAESEANSETTDSQADRSQRRQQRQARRRQIDNPGSEAAPETDQVEATSAEPPAKPTDQETSENSEASDTAERVTESASERSATADTDTANTDTANTDTANTDTANTDTANTDTADADTADADTADAEATRDRSNPTTPARESAPIPGVPAPSIDPLGNGSAFDSNLLNNTPAPEYLNPSPNPLFFPTQTEEVELVGTQPITMQQAIELAIRNNPDLQQAQLQLERSQADLRNTQSANYPTLDATSRFTQSGQEVPEPAPQTILNEQGLPVNNPDAGEFGRAYTDSTVVGAGLELNYTVFTSGRRSALIEAARGQVRLQQLDVERQTEQLILDTIGDYYDLQQAGAQVNIFSANLAQAEQSLRDAQALERAGVGTRFDVLQAEVDVANARQRLTQQLSDLEVSRRELAQRLNLTQTVNISAADPIEVAGVWDLSLEESIVQAYKNRVELEQQLIQREIAQKNRQAALAQLGPQVGFQGTFDLSTDVDQQGGPNYSYSLGLNARLALYDGGAARSQANREESNIAIAESTFESARDQIRLDVERGYSQLNASFANIQTTALAVEQAAEALRLARLRFQAGVGTQTDVLRQQSVLAEAQVNNLTAILDYNRALAVLQRGISNYPDGYLNDAP